jgi:hypothetical protein
MLPKDFVEPVDLGLEREDVKTIGRIMAQQPIK